MALLWGAPCNKVAKKKKLGLLVGAPRQEPDIPQSTVVVLVVRVCVRVCACACVCVCVRAGIPGCLRWVCVEGWSFIGEAGGVFV